MKRILLSVIALLWISVTAAAQAQATYNNYRSGNRYDFNIISEQLAKTPEWTEDQDNPPLSPRAAIKIAKTQMQRLFVDADKWTSRGLQIHQLGNRWIYLVEFTEPPPPGALDYISSPFRIPVLMNGETVEPQVSAWRN